MWPKSITTLSNNQKKIYKPRSCRSILIDVMLESNPTIQLSNYSNFAYLAHNHGQGDQWARQSTSTALPFLFWKNWLKPPHVPPYPLWSYDRLDSNLPQEDSPGISPSRKKPNKRHHNRISKPGKITLSLCTEEQERDSLPVQRAHW